MYGGIPYSFHRTVTILNTFWLTSYIFPADASNSGGPSTTTSDAGQSLVPVHLIARPSKTKAARKDISYTGAAHSSKNADDGDGDDEGDGDGDDDEGYTVRVTAKNKSIASAVASTSTDRNETTEHAGATSASSSATAPAASQSDADTAAADALVVIALLAHKFVRKRLHYQVRWSGPPKADTWEPAATLNCAALVERYRVDHPDAVLSDGNAADNRAAATVARAAQDIEYEVEQILGHRGELRSFEYLIRWKGYATEYDTWEPESTLCCPDLLREYQQAHAGQFGKRLVKVPPRKRAKFGPEHDYEVRFFVGLFICFLQNGVILSFDMLDIC